MYSESMHPVIFLKVNLGVARALKNIENTYWTPIIRVEKRSKAADLELYRDSFEHYYLVISGVL